MDWVAGAGLSGAKEAPGFRAGAFQPRPPINPLLTEHYGGADVCLVRESIENLIKLTP